MKSSIIIPTAGRPVAIKAAVHSLLAISPELNNAEVLVVDNNQQVELSEALRSFCSSLPEYVRYLREPSPGLGAARHAGYRAAKGELLTFIDDDVEVTSGWLSAIQRGFSNPDVGMVGGASIPKFTGSVPAWFWEYLDRTPYGGWMCGWLSLIDIGHDQENIDPDYIWGLNFSIRKDVLERCGGFHPDLVPASLQRWQGDGETGLTQKMKALGFRADYVQDAMLFHLCSPDRLNVEYFKKRAYYQGVCDSFTKIRQGMTPSENSEPVQKQSLYLECMRHLRKTMNRLFSGNSMWKDAAATVRIQTEKAYLDGWKFHQAEASKDPQLLAWIRRNDFWDADIQVELDQMSSKE